VISLILLGVAQEAREVLFTDRPVEVRVPVSGEAQHRATVVTFPEESLEALVAGWNEGDLSVERRGENLFLKLLRRAEGDLHVLGTSGRLYRLAVRPAEGVPYDGRVRIAIPPRASERAAEPEPVRLIRAMRLGRRPPEGEVRRASGLLHRSGGVVASLAYLYETDACRGYVARVENLSGGPVRLDPSRFTAPDLALAGARELLLRPGEKTWLYLVFWKRS